MLYDIARAMRKHQKEIAAIVAMETGMSFNAALGETGGAIAQGEFMAGEGRRFYGRTTTSAVPNKYAMTVRQPLGVAGLIIAANTPIANVAWKVFPALICGNAAVLKAAEDTPATAWYFGKIAHEVGLPPGVLNVIQGQGAEAGGFYMVPTLIENVDPKDDISTFELFGPITCLYRVSNFQEALQLANASPYGLSACIHTLNFQRAIEFSRKIQAGVTVVNEGMLSFLIFNI